MKTLLVRKLSLLAAGIIGLWPVATTVWADDVGTNAPVTTAAAAPVVTPAPAPAAVPAGNLQLSYGVPQVIQLAQAQISDSTIVAYIRQSGNSYGLDANQIIYLRQLGISDTVISAMLSQPKPGAAVPGSAVASTAPVTAPADGTQAPVTTMEPAPATVTYIPSSSVYVIPDSTAYPYYYYPNYYAYPYYAPIGVSIGFGGRFGGHFGGGFHGGWHH